MGKKVVFIFRRDLRVDDNSGLLHALKHGLPIIPLFIIDPQQVGKHNQYRSDNALQYMAESLQDLAHQLEKKGGRLYIVHGLVSDILATLIQEHSIDAVYYNRDYTPYAQQRDDAMDRVLQHHQIAVHRIADALLNEPESIAKKDGSFYSVFTPFFKASLQKIVPKPRLLESKTANCFFKGTVSGALSIDLMIPLLVPVENKQLAIRGGTTEAMRIVKHMSIFKSYAKTHDYPATQTTHLSAHLKFGTCSVRQVYYAIKNTMHEQSIVRQLYWRDFFTHIAYHRPQVFGHAFKARYDQISWNTDKRLFKAWCEGKTGFPLVDAGMRELNATGYMHNRVRMVVASFLVKNLHCDWRLGERYFAQKLVDYDPCVNNGNWQWAASTGADSQPYFRIFNPWLQQKKYDADCVYIKQWVPELRSVEPKRIHTLYAFEKSIVHNYPAPIVDFAVTSRSIKEMFKKTKSII